MAIIIMMLKFVQNAIIHGYIFLLFIRNSLTCDEGTSSDCLTCNTSTTNHRYDNSTIGKCLCKDGYFEN